MIIRFGIIFIKVSLLHILHILDSPTRYDHKAHFTISKQVEALFSVISPVVIKDDRENIKGAAKKDLAVFSTFR